jgi:hypothetical protein
VGTGFALIEAVEMPKGGTMTVSVDEWKRCQETIRKLLRWTGKDALVYAKGALEHEDSEPDRLNIFWQNARRCFDESERTP